MVEAVLVISAGFGLFHSLCGASLCVPVQPVSTAALSALINISDSPKALGQMLKKRIIGALMDGLKARLGC